MDLERVLFISEVFYHLIFTAGVAGLAPNVSFYLDEQPLAQPGRNFDVYAADMQRIEVLAGPQEPFGASSQAGVVRMITNKPVIGESSGNAEVESRVMPEGDTGAKIELVEFSSRRFNCS